MPKLKIITGPDSGFISDIEKVSFSLGRSKTVDFIIQDPSISRHHATILNENGNYFIEDNKSNNGLFVNNIKISKKQLSNGDIISIGNSVLEFIFENVSNDFSDIVINDQNSLDLEKSIMMDITDFNRINQSSNNEKNLFKIQAMLRISNAVANIFEIHELINELLSIIFTETKATRGFIMLYNENNELIPMAIKKTNNNSDAITISNTIINTVVKQKKAILSSDLLNDDRFNTGQSIIANQIKSCMVAPLIYHDEILGIIHIDSDVTTSIFNQDDLELLVALANQASVSIKNSYLIKKLTDEENKRFKLSQYFPPAQVEMLMKDNSNISLGGKRENVTIIFCDIRGFTCISEALEAIEVMNFLNEFFTIMTDIIFKHGGMVDNFMGDCIMAVFGGPFHHENDQDLAVKAAIEMQIAQKELNKKFANENKKTFQIGIGINSGDVSRGNIGSPQLKKYTVIGSNVNITSRLCSLAKAGEILVSNSVKEKLSNDIKLEQMEPVKVKNVTEPLIPYKIMYC